jgi:cytochrome P450 family 6
MNESATNRTPIDITDILCRYTTDAIESIAFGLECNSLKDPDSLFRKYGKRVFELDMRTQIKTLLQFALPHRVLKPFKFKQNKPDVEEFFIKPVN